MTKIQAVSFISNGNKFCCYQELKPGKNTNYVDEAQNINTTHIAVINDNICQVLYL